MSASTIKTTNAPPPGALTGLVRPDSVGRAESGKAAPALPAAAEFRQALEQASLPVAAQPQAPLPTAGAPGQALGQLKFSQHAIERMRSRGIGFTSEQMRGIEGAVAKAAQKGSKDTLVLAGDSALIVSVKNGTVVTVMDKAAMRENVFTNIDSTVVI